METELVEDEPFGFQLGGGVQVGGGAGVGVEFASVIEAEDGVEGVEPELVRVEGVGGLHAGSLPLRH